MATTANVKRYSKDATYVNIQTKDIDSLAENLGKVSLEPKISSAEAGQVTLHRQDRVKDKDEVKEEESAEPIYANCRGPENGIPSSSYVTDWPAAQHTAYHSGSKRGPGYQSMPDSEKYLRPQYQSFMTTHLFRRAEENEDPYYVNQQAQSNPCDNIPRPNQQICNLTSATNRKPVPDPRSYGFHPLQTPNQSTFSDLMLNDYILNGPNGPMQTHQPATTVSHMSGDRQFPTTHADSTRLEYYVSNSSSYPPSNESLGSPGQHSCSTQHSPSPRSTSQSSSPPHVYGNIHSSQLPVTSSFVQHPSPSCSQTAWSPLTDVSTSDDVSFYPLQSEAGNKYENVNLPQPQGPLPKTLDPDFFEKFVDVSGINNSSNVPEYINFPKRDTQCHFQQPPQPYFPPHKEEQPAMCPYPRAPSYPPHTCTAPAVPINTTTNNNNKLPIQRLTNPPASTATPSYSIFVVVPQPPPKPAQGYKNILPRPSSEAPTHDQKSASKGRAKKGSRKKSSDVADNTRNTHDETEEARRMVSKETDESLLKKENGETFLTRAISTKKQRVIVALIGAIQQRPALVPLLTMTNSKEQTPLFLSVTTGSAWLTDLLVKMHCDCDTLCRYEICEGQVEYLSALHYASKFGDRHLKELKAILGSKSVDVNALSRSGMTALHLALWRHGETDGKTKKLIDSRKVIKELLDAGASCTISDNKTGKSCLHFAVESGSLDITRMVLESKCHVESLIDQKNYDRRTPLHFAVSLRRISEENKVDLVKYLISKGANKSSKDKNKLTPKDLVSPKETKILDLFSESMSPSHFLDDDDSLQSLLCSSP
ncbi:uncharacterized protein [Watersipora subatra]|uniref:uncharacterized protein isoform X3 n=1 Tax=Watersipora subatra TaxID=2589382 RepID=UPI00355C3F17